MHGLYATDASWLDTAGRLLIVGFFLIVGIRNLQRVHIDDHVKRLTMFHAPLPAVTFWIGQALEFASCALILADWHARWGAIGLIVFTVLATGLLLRFWDAPNPGMRMGMQNGFLANIAVVGGLLLLVQNARW